MEIPRFDNEDEERDFWATHDSADFLDGAEPIKLKNEVLAMTDKEPTQEQIDVFKMTIGLVTLS